MCCLNLTTIDQSSMVWERKDFPNPKTFPNRKQKRAITKEEWESLVQSIDAKALQAVPQENGCRGCIDLPDAWLVVEYSDGSKISVHYDPAARRPVPVEKLKFPRIQIILYP